LDPYLTEINVLNSIGVFLACLVLPKETEGRLFIMRIEQFDKIEIE
jgi:hypothetical protein